MKQITLDQAKAIAFSDQYRMNLETQYCQQDWIKNNARYIADIELKRCDKTAYGQFPKGWKAEMKRASEEMAKADILARFLREQCKQLDGAIWLGNWQMIEQLEKKSPQ